MKIVMRLFQHRGIWYIETNGKRRSLQTRDKAEAKRLYAVAKKEQLAGRISQITGRSTKSLEEYAKEFLEWSAEVQPRATYRANRLALDKLMMFAGKKIHLDAVSRRHLDQMTADCRKRGLKSASINNYIRHARSSLNKAVEWGYLQANPLTGARELPAEKGPPEFLDRAGIAMVLSQIDILDLRRLVVAYLCTGRRRSELLSLRWEHVDIEAGRYYIAQAKNHLSRWYPLNGMFRSVLDSMERSEKGRVFSRWEHPDTISHRVKQALTAAGYGNLHLHHLRHTYASLQAMEGRTLFEIQKLLGHSAIHATQIYAHLTEEHLREASEINLGPVDLDGKK